MPRKAPKIADLKYRIALCTSKDVVVSGAVMELRREAVVWTWAAIEHQTHMSSFLSRAGYAVQEPANRPTHRITVRAGLDLEYSSAAWVYEVRLKSAPRWYKVVGFVEEDCHVMLECHLVERNEDAKPVNVSPLKAAPQDVEL